MTTTYYYVSYGKPPRPPLWRYLLLGLLLVLAVALAAGIGYGIYELASGGGNPTSTEGADNFYLPEALADLYEGAVPGNIFFVPDGGSGGVTLERDLPPIPDAFMTLNPPTSDSGRVLLVNGHEDFPDPIGSSPVDDVEAEEAWLKAVHELVSRRNSPDYIYDKVAVAHDRLASLDNGNDANTIILVTDGLDGGYAVFDTEAIGLCPPKVSAEPGDVCGPMLETVVADVDRLVACPLELVAPPDFVCHPKSPVGADDAVIVYDPVHPESLMSCPPEVGGAGAVCYDRVVDYLPFSRDAIVPCPLELDAAPGQACAELRSKTTEEELLAMIAASPVPNLRVHVIGLGDREDHEFLRLLAVAGNGEYIYCSARGCDSP